MIVLSLQYFSLIYKNSSIYVIRNPRNISSQGGYYSYYLLYLVLIDLIEAFFSCLLCLP